MRRKLRKLLADRDEGIACDSENLTLGSYLDRWLDAVKGSVRERTWERHEQVVRVHLKPTIGSVKLDRVNALQVQSMYRRKLEAGLLPRSVAIVHATLRKALKQAVKVVSEMLGHAGVSIMLDTYSHVLPNMQEAAAKAMEDALQ